jgi:hypothetical protein
MLTHRSILIVLSIFLLTACTEMISFALSPAATAVVYDLGAKSERSISPNTEAHRKLVQWVAANREGWEPYLATPPALGVIVRAPEVNIQFVGTSAIVHTKQGVLSKKVAPSEYAFLLSQNGA